jgi:L-aminopeptidase/D-esterase-like protein
VIVLPPSAVCSAEVRGMAPGTRELALLAPHATVTHADAIVFCGGSALGLAAASGVADALAEQGIGFATPAGPVPIVPAAVIYDLAVGERRAPGPAEGRAALADALGRGDEPWSAGRVGAGTGATVGKLDGAASAMAGGIGVARVGLRGGASIAALAVVNSFGDVIASDGTQLAGLRRGGRPVATETVLIEQGLVTAPLGAATTLVLVATDASVDKLACYRLARSVHAGIAQATRPAATAFDGDCAFALATGGVAPPPAPVLETAAAAVAAAAIRAAVAA